LGAIRTYELSLVTINNLNVTHVQVCSAVAAAGAFVPQVEESVDNWVHDRVGAGKDEKEVLNSLIHLLERTLID